MKNISNLDLDDIIDLISKKAGESEQEKELLYEKIEEYGFSQILDDMFERIKNQ